MNIKSFLGCLGIGMAVSLSVGLGTAAGVKNTDVKGANAANNGRFSILIDDDSWWKNDYAQIWATYSS